MKKEKVLIVEDELDLLDLVDFNLTRKGFVTAGALDGLEAMEKVESFNPDIIVLDLMLPKLDGWEICKLLKLKKKDIPVIMLTAKCMPEDKVKGLESGADDYITKPFNVKELIIRINNLLVKKRDKDLQRMLIHEVTNRLSTIGCYSEILSKKDETLGIEKRSKYLRNINQQVSFTTEMISEVGTLIDVESGEFSLRREKCDIAEVVNHVSESYRSTSAHKGITITVNSDLQVPEVEADIFAMKQVFTNLIGNGVKYGKLNGRIDVLIENAAGGVAVRIKDDGFGIPADELPHIFEKGYRASNIPKGIRGSGLGLYLVKILLDRMGATITVGSEDGKGSAFAVFFKTNFAPISHEKSNACNKDITCLS